MGLLAQRDPERHATSSVLKLAAFGQEGKQNGSWAADAAH